MTTKVSVSKIDAAKRQLNTAIIMYFNDMDFISTHAVAAGSLQVVTDLAEKQKQKVGIEDFVSIIRDDRKEEFKHLLRKPQNFIKHANWKNDEKATLEYNPETLDYFIFIACQAYEQYTNTSTPEIKIFMGWICLRNTEILVDGKYKQSILKYIDKFGTPNINNKSLFLTSIKLFRESRNARATTPIDYG